MLHMRGRGSMHMGAVALLFPVAVTSGRMGPSGRTLLYPLRFHDTRSCKGKGNVYLYRPGSFVTTVAPHSICTSLKTDSFVHSSHARRSRFTSTTTVHVCLPFLSRVAITKSTRIEVPVLKCRNWIVWF
jgi:hypothetical protein